MIKTKRWLEEKGMVSMAGIMLLSIAVLMAAVGAYFIEPLVDGFDVARSVTTSQTDEFTGRSTAGHVTNDNLTLTQSVYNNDKAYVSSVTTNITTDNISVGTVSGTSIQISDLDNNIASRTITISYGYGTLDNFTATDTVVQVGPTLIVLGYVVAVGIVGFLGIKNISS